MVKGNCSMDGCLKPLKARGLCGGHYSSERRAGRLALIERPPMEQRFWSRVDRRSPDECWPWVGYLNSNGYGIWKERPGRGQRARPASRLAFYFTHGYYPPVVRHKCDNPPCCNPAHLEPGTQVDNLADMTARGRSTRGVRNPAAKLTEAQVREVRRRLADGERNGDISHAMGISRNRVYEIRTGKVWSHVA